MKRLIKMVAACVLAFAGMSADAMPLGLRTLMHGRAAVRQAVGNADPAPDPLPPGGGGMDGGSGNTGDGVATDGENPGGGDVPPDVVPDAPIAVVREYAGTVADVQFVKAQAVSGALFDAAGNLVGVVEVKTGKAGAKGVKISATATIVQGGKEKKVAAKAVTMPAGAASATLSFKAPVGDMAFTMRPDGRFTLEGGYGKMSEAKVGGSLPNGRRTFTADIGSVPSLGGGSAVLAEALPAETGLSVTGGKKLDAGKAATLKYAKDKASGAFRLSGLDDPAKPNVSGLKRSYTPKTGLFKGSFKVYAVTEGAKPKLKSATANIVGFVLDFGEGSVGIGQATLKKPAAGPWAVTIR